ncbi:MAG: putative metal-binding motif-containing protein, partial [archaeon]
MGAKIIAVLIFLSIIIFSNVFAVDPCSSHCTSVRAPQDHYWDSLYGGGARAGRCSADGLSCSSNEVCFQGYTVICTEADNPPWHEICIDSSNRLGCACPQCGSAGACYNKSTYYRDADGDGYGLASASTLACSAPTGYVSTSTDCDDLDITIKPTAIEICDGKDNDCDGLTDEGSVCAVCYDGNPSTIINHANKDWNILSNIEVAGKHINVKNFKIASGVKVNVKPFNGTTCGTFDVNAQNIFVDGNL